MILNENILSQPDKQIQHQFTTYEELRKYTIEQYEDNISYSHTYYDEYSEYRHVTLPRQIAQYMPHNRLLTDDEWRSLAPEPHILLFKREKFYKQKYLTEQTTEPDNPTATTTTSTNVDVVDNKAL
ncbi:17062_t:CDS:2 [Entrophospora sp. SA101]|nr:17055_t:CDS:2 [Entrophospora sp. SA101]CAJ0915389.1 17062_t:CDS:2 [Entrophospora sp. SA101]